MTTPDDSVRRRSWEFVRRLADLCAVEQIPFVLGHALYMKAIHGAKAKNDHIDSRKVAVLLRGGAFLWFCSKTDRISAAEGSRGLSPISIARSASLSIAPATHGSHFCMSSTV